MKLSKAKLMREAERFLKRTKAYQENRELGCDGNYEIAYVIAKAGRTQPESVLAYAIYEDSMLSFYPFRGETSLCEDWAFNFDDDLFEPLENGYEIVGMTLDSHFGVWATIEDWKDGDIEHENGMQKYLAYCKRNGVTKELLQEKVSYDGMDVMELYVKEVPEKQKREQER